MRKSIRTIITAILLTVTMISAAAQGQIRITTKKEKISDFTAKTTKVVMSGNEMSDQFLKNAMSSSWRLSPYEYCTKDEFATLKTDPQYYFLMAVNGQSGKESEPGITFLTLVKGGAEAKDGIDAMLEIVTIPYCSSRFPSGRETLYLPAILDIMQDFTGKQMEGDLKGYVGLPYYNTQLPKSKSKDIFFSEDDLNADMTDEMIGKTFRTGMTVLVEDSADEIFAKGEQAGIVSYTVYPSEAQEGSICYKMLIDVLNHNLYYFKKHKITGKTGPGFMADDIKKIAAPRKK